MKQQVIVDENGAISEINIPWFGKLQTNYPSLVAVLLGVSLAFYVTSKLQPQIAIKRVPLTAKLTTSELPKDSYIFVSAVPQRYLTATNSLAVDGKSTITLSVDETGPYSVIAYTIADIASDNRTVYAVTHGPAIFENEPEGFVFEGRLAGREKVKVLFDASND